MTDPTPMTREPKRRDGMEPDTYVTLDCGHTAFRYNNLRSDPTGWQTHCDVCNATRTVTASRRREPRPTPMTREQAWDTLRRAIDWHYKQSEWNALSFIRTEMERLEMTREPEDVGGEVPVGASRRASGDSHAPRTADDLLAHPLGVDQQMLREAIDAAYPLPMYAALRHEAEAALDRLCAVIRESQDTPVNRAIAAWRARRVSE